MWQVFYFNNFEVKKMKNLIISMLVIIASVSFQPNLEGNNSNTFTHDLLESNKTIFTQDCNKTSLLKLIDCFETGDKKINIQIDNKTPETTNATYNLVSSNHNEVLGPYYIEEGNIQEHDVSDESWVVEIIQISEDTELNYWYN